MMEFKKFFRSLFIIMLLAFLVWTPLFTFNVIIDPYGIFFRAYKNFPSEANRRYIKMRFLTKNPDKFDSYVFGSSRANMINPENIPWCSCFNMTCSLGLPVEHLQDVKYMTAHGVKIKNLLIGLDYIALLYNPPNNDNNLIRKKYPETLSEKVDFYKTYLFNRPGFDYIALLKYDAHVDRSKILVTGITQNIMDKTIEKKTENYVERPLYFKPTIKDWPQTSIRKNLEPIQELVEFCTSNHINLIFFLNPIHYITHLDDDASKYYTALRELAQITSFYDFSGLNSVTMNNANYFETSHFREFVGDMIISRIFHENDNTLPDDFGFCINSNNVDDHIRWHQKQMDKYFNAINLMNTYIPPVDLSECTKMDRETGHSVSSVNGSVTERDTLVISSPIITVQGKSHIANNHQDIYIQIGNKIFSTIPDQGKLYRTKFGVPEPDESFFYWESIIPSRQVGPGLHDISLVVVNGRSYSKSYVESVKVTGKLNKIPDYENLNVLSQLPVLNVGQNQQTIFLFDTSDHGELFIKGWACDTAMKTPSGGVIASSGNFACASQFLIDRPDGDANPLATHLKSEGWGVVLPSKIFTNEENDLTIHVLSNSLKAIYASGKTFTVIKYSGQNYNYISGLTALHSDTRYSIDAINNIDPNHANQHFELTEDMVKVRGWAIDMPEKTVASGVILMIDDHQFLCTYGLARMDVGKAFNNSDYNSCGWEIEVPAKIPGNGLHNLTIKILSGDGKSYYSIRENIKISIR